MGNPSREVGCDFLRLFAERFPVFEASRCVALESLTKNIETNSTSRFLWELWLQGPTPEQAVQELTQ